MIYILTAGEYDDYMIVGVYSTLAKARKARDIYNKDIKYTPDLARVEKWKIDEIPSNYQ